MFNLAVVLLLTGSRAIINDLDVILHGFMLQIIHIMVFQVKRLNNLSRSRKPWFKYYVCTALTMSL